MEARAFCLVRRSPCPANTPFPEHDRRATGWAVILRMDANAANSDGIEFFEATTACGPR